MPVERKNVQCWWAWLWYGDAGKLFEIAFLFVQWSSEEGYGCKSGDRGGCQDGCGGGCKNDLGSGCISVVVVVANGMGLSMEGGGASDRERAVRSCGGSVCADIRGTS